MVQILLFVSLVLCLGGCMQSTASLHTQAAREPVPDLSHYPGMFALYEANRTEGLGNYITADFVLTAYGLLMQDVLMLVEAETIFPAFQDLTTTLMQALQRLPTPSQASDTALAYVAVLQRLLTPTAVIPPRLAPRVRTELALIEAHQGIAPSAISGVREDYSQYVPRGHYAASETLQRYFRAFTYAGRLGFFLRESRATGVNTALAEQHTAAALLLSRLLMNDEGSRQRYDQIQRLLEAFIGPSDDLTPAEYMAAAGTLPPSQARQRILERLKQNGRYPRILSAIADTAALEPGLTMAEAVAGLRLFPQRYTPEAEALQQLTYDRVTTYRGQGMPFTVSVIGGNKVRGMPSVLDVMATMGSDKARQLLTMRGDTAYDGYQEQFAAVAGRFQKQTTQPVAGRHLALIALLLRADTPEGLNTALGFWLHTRHALLLYTKQSYTTAEKSFRLVPPRHTAAIEPAVALYEQVSAALAQFAGLIDQQTARGEIAAFDEIVRRLRAIAVMQQQRQLTPEEITYLNEVDQNLQRVLSTTDTPLVVDLHTEPTSQLVLEAGLGYPLTTPGFKTDVARGALRGGRFHCYEFKYPLAQRLTDAAWLSLLQEGKATGSLASLLLRTLSPERRAHSRVERYVQGIPRQ